MERIGVFVCHCGTNIAGVVDVEKVAEELGYEVLDINDTFREMLLEGDHTIIVKVSSYGRFEQGIDFAVTTKWLFDFGRSEKLVGKLYSHIGKYVKFKGVSLHK